MDKQHNHNWLSAKVVDGEEATRRIDDRAAALRDEWFKIGHAFLAAKEFYPSTQAFGEWLRRSPMARWSKDERASAIHLAKHELFARKALEGTAVANVEWMWKRVAELIRLAPPPSSEASELDPDRCEEPESVDGIVNAQRISESAAPENNKEHRFVVTPRPSSRQGDIEKLIGDDAALVRGWYCKPGKTQVVPGISKIKSEKVVLAAVAAAVKSGECIHAPVAGSDVFDIRMAFPHIPEVVAKTVGRYRTWKELKSKSRGRDKSDWERFAELNDLCKARSTYSVEKPAPNGTYRLRDTAHEDEIGQAARQWWHSGHWPGERPPLRLAVSTPPASEPPPPQNNKEIDQAEAVFLGMVLWPLPPSPMIYINSRGDQAPARSTDDPTTPTKQDVDNTYWFVEELHRTLVAHGLSHSTAARYIRNWSKYIGALVRPAGAASIMQAMAQGIDTHGAYPERNLDLKNKMPSRPTRFAVEG